MNYLVYQVYGSSDVLTEALFSILSFLRVASGQRTVQVVVYTDDPTSFKAVLGQDAPVIYEHVNAKQWQEWRGAIDFVHRVKLKVLEHAAANYAGNLLYADSDTVFRQSPERLFEQIEAGRPVFHVSEGTMGGGNLLNRKIFRRLKGQQFIAGTMRFKVPGDAMMYNAGMVGFRSQDASVITQVLKVTEALYRFYPKHVMEQLAFSLQLPKMGSVIEAEPYVLHYWNLKHEARPLLASFFAKYQDRPWLEMAEMTQRLDLANAARSKQEYYLLPGWRRTIRKLTGRRWQMPKIDV